MSLNKGLYNYIEYNHYIINRLYNNRRGSILTSISI